MKQLRLTTLVLAGTVSLTACLDTPTRPIPGGTPSLSVEETEPSSRHIFIFADRAVPADFEERVAHAGGTLEHSFAGMGMASVTGLDSTTAADLGATPDVAHWSEDVELALQPLVDEPAAEAAVDEPDAPENPTTAVFYPRQWHLRQIGAHHAWAAGRLGSPGVRVGILDTGIDYRHADLVGRVDLSLSRSFVPEDDAFLRPRFPGAHPVADLHYHGTHVAATVSSNARAAAGVTSRVTLVGIKVLNRNGSGNSFNTLRAIEYAADVGLDVINMSLGVRTPLSRDQFAWFNEMINRSMEYAHARGTAVVVSAGNENLDLSKLSGAFKAYCTASTVTCVSATGPTSQASVNGPWTDIDAKAGYSNYGRNHISVAAPGGNGASRVTAACSGFSFAIPICRTGTFVLGINGTSMAAPHVTALAALIVEQVGKRQPGLVRQRLQQAADDLGESGTDPIYGKGRINVARALGLN